MRLRKLYLLFGIASVVAAALALPFESGSWPRSIFGALTSWIVMSAGWAGGRRGGLKHGALLGAFAFAAQAVVLVPWAVLQLGPSALTNWPVLLAPFLFACVGAFIGMMAGGLAQASKELEAKDGAS